MDFGVSPAEAEPTLIVDFEQQVKALPTADLREAREIRDKMLKSFAAGQQRQ